MNFNSELLKELLNEDLSKVTGDVRSFAASALCASLFKKYVSVTESDSLDREAIQNFVSFNDEISNFKIKSDFLTSPLFFLWKDKLYQAFHSYEFQTSQFSLDRFIDHGYCGPGSSIGCRDTSFFTKMFDSPLTCTKSSLHRHYVANISERWAAAEEIRSCIHPLQVVRGSKLSTVPKDNTKNRTICTEPTLNMFYQLGAKHYIETVLKRFCRIDLSRQADLNKELARISSIDDSFATIDLKNASDSISLELCNHLLPKDIFQTLDCIRSHETMLPGGDYIKLNMISTMGNGFTFPLMTLMFATLVESIYQLEGLAPKNGVNYCVFGDDIIVEKHVSDKLVEALHCSGFQVNLDKSFFTGPFKESCGGDFYKGHDVRGVYIKEMRNEGQCYSAFNRLHFWSIRHNIPLTRTLRYLKGLVEFLPVPGHCSVDEGFIVTTDQITNPRFNLNGSRLYKSLTPVAFRVSVKRFEHNHHGLLIALLGGYVRNNKITFRLNSVKYRVARKVTPCWNNFTSPGILYRDLSQSWEELLSSS